MLILARIVVYFGNVISTALVLRAILSWFSRGGNNMIYKVYSFLHAFTEPIVSPVRNLMSKYFNTGMFDFSIFVTMVLVSFVTRVIVRLLLLFV